MARVTCHGRGCGRPVPTGVTYCPRCRPAKRSTPAGGPRTYRGTAQYRNVRKTVMDRDGGICWICHQPGADVLDHIIPHANGGPFEPDNLRAAHRSCNARRGRRPATHRGHR